MQTNQDMQVVRHAVDRKHSAALILYNAGDVFVDLFLMSRAMRDCLPSTAKTSWVIICV
jgi:hypothetical protein